MQEFLVSSLGEMSLHCPGRPGNGKHNEAQSSILNCTNKCDVESGHIVTRSLTNHCYVDSASY